MTTEVPRKRGRPPRLTREQIVAAASTFDADALTMDALARELGVDRKSLNYHLGDREGLLEAVAEDLFLAGLTESEIAPTVDWRELLRSHGVAVLRGFLRAGSYSTYVPLSGPVARAQLLQAEALLELLVAAGFDDQDAGRAVALLTEYAFGAAMEMLLGRGREQHPQRIELDQALGASADDELPVLRRILAGRTTYRDEADFAFALDVIVAGLERVLEDR